MGYNKLAVGKFCTEPLRREPRLIFAMFAARLLRAVLAPLVYILGKMFAPLCGVSICVWRFAPNTGGAARRPCHDK